MTTYSCCRFMRLASWGGMVPLSWLKERSLKKPQRRNENTQRLTVNRLIEIIDTRKRSQGERSNYERTNLRAEWGWRAEVGWCRWADSLWGSWDSDNKEWEHWSRSSVHHLVSIIKETATIMSLHVWEFRKVAELWRDCAIELIQEEVPVREKTNESKKCSWDSHQLKLNNNSY